MTDVEATQILSNPLRPFSEPSSQTKSAFETRVAPIHTASSNNVNDDIAEIKEDSLWLSKEARIDELAALRLALLEWQNRPAEKILSGFAGEEYKSVQDVAASASFGVSSLLGASLSASMAVDLQTGPDHFSSTLRRRFRLLKLYVSERVHALKVSEYLVRTPTVDKYIATRLGGRNSHLEGSQPIEWIKALGSDVLQAQQQLSGNQALAAAVQILDLTVDNLLGPGGSNWQLGEEMQDEIELVYRKGKMAEMVHILQLMLVHLDGSPPSKSVVLEWFSFTAKYDFFRELWSVSDIHCLQAMTHESFSNFYDFPSSPLTHSSGRSHTRYG